MSSKADILAAASVAYGESALAGHKIRIRGLTTGEENQHLAEGFAKGEIGVCSACIVDDEGKAMFTAAELEKMKGGVLKPVFRDILQLTYPQVDEDAEKNS